MHLNNRMGEAGVLLDMLIVQYVYMDLFIFAPELLFPSGLEPELLLTASSIPLLSGRVRGRRRSTRSLHFGQCSNLGKQPMKVIRYGRCSSIL